MENSLLPVLTIVLLLVRGKMKQLEAYTQCKNFVIDAINKEFNWKSMTSAFTNGKFNLTIYLTLDEVVNLLLNRNENIKYFSFWGFLDITSSWYRV